MSRKKIGLVVLMVFIFSLVVIMPFTFANSTKINTDPSDDILKSSLLKQDNMQDWLDSFYFGDRYPNFKGLYELRPTWFSVKEGPDCIDTIEWGINDYGNNISSIYVKVEDITDYMDKDYFSIDILIIYEDENNDEKLRLFGELDFEDDDLIDNDYITEFNHGEANEDDMTGEVDIYTVNNSYEIYFNTAWITETDVDIITDNMYGLTFGYCWNTSARENITHTYFDFFPNSYYGQEFAEEEEEDDDYIYPFMEPVLFMTMALIFLLMIFLIFMIYSRSKKGGRSKRNKCKKGDKTLNKTKNVASIFYFVFASIVMLVILLVTLGIIVVV